MVTLGNPLMRLSLTAVADCLGAGAFGGRPPRAHLDRATVRHPCGRREPLLPPLTERAIANRATTTADGVRHASSWILVDPVLRSEL